MAMDRDMNAKFNFSCAKLSFSSAKFNFRHVRNKWMLRRQPFPSLSIPFKGRS